MEPIKDISELILKLHLLKLELQQKREERGDVNPNIMTLTEILAKHASLLEKSKDPNLGAAVIDLAKETDRLHLTHKKVMDAIHHLALRNLSLMAEATDKGRVNRAEEGLQLIAKRLKEDYYPLFDKKNPEKQVDDFYRHITTHLRQAAPLKLNLIQHYGSLKHPEALAILANEFADTNFVWFAESPSFHKLIGGALEFPAALSASDKAASLRGWLLSLSEEILKDFTTLDLRQRNLFLLPPEISVFEHLKELHLENNHLRYLPRSLSRLRQLERIYIEGNEFSQLSPLQDLPDHIEIITKEAA